MRANLKYIITPESLQGDSDDFLTTFTGCLKHNQAIILSENPCCGWPGNFEL